MAAAAAVEVAVITGDVSLSLCQRCSEKEIAPKIAYEENVSKLESTAFGGLWDEKGKA